MAPHIEKSQLISKPTTRRGTSKSPSKPANENNEMPQQGQEHSAPRKVSGQLPQIIVPGRKISAPELSKPSVSRGGRRNLFTERCISQEEKQKSKDKTSMRKFSTPAISLTNGTSKNVSENDDPNDPSNCQGNEVKPNSAAPKTEAPKTILPVYEVCTTASNKNKQTCQITKPQIQEHVPTPVNRRKKPPSIDLKSKENELKLKEEKSTRRISAPMFHISQEGSNNASSGTRKLYTERCISTEEKEHIKSKPIVKKPPKETSNIKEAGNSQDSDEKIEKVQLKPKSAQRKLSAPAKMMTPPALTIDVITRCNPDLLSNGIVLDESMSAIREENGKPSFAMAAKVVHAKVQVVSCFRSSGAMPIPRVPQMAPNPRPKPRKLELPSTQEAQEIDLDVPTELVSSLPCFDYSSLEHYLTESQVPRFTRCMIIPHPKIIDIINGFKGISEEVILRNTKKYQQRPAPPPSEYMTGSCSKHSRCHCNLLSKDVNDFYAVTPQ